jgi:hypothetical protein
MTILPCSSAANGDVQCRARYTKPDVQNGSCE